MIRCLLCLLLTGCAAPDLKRVATPATTARAEAGRERYWAEQRTQQPDPAPAFEWLELRRPEHTEDGVLRAATVEYLRIPRSP